MPKGQAKRTPSKKARFLRALLKTGNVTLSAKAASWARCMAYFEREKDEAFAAAWDEAHEAFLDSLEAEVIRRGFRGVREPVGWYQGTPGGFVKRYSDNLAMFVLKAERPDKYRERSEVEHKGNVTLVVEKLCDG